MEKLQEFLNSKYVNKILYASAKIKIVVMLLFFLIFSFFFYGILVGPVIIANNSIESNINIMTDQIPRIIKKEKDLQSLKAQVKELELFNAKERFSIPERHSIPIFLSALNEAMSSSNITIISLSPAGVEKNKYLDLYALNFKAKLSGDFTDLVKLFVALIDMKDIAVITNINIKRESDSNLIVDLNLQTYSRQGEG
jgi:type IV pilus assembly protein PilO